MRIKLLETQFEELTFEQELLKKQPSKYVKFDLVDLDDRLDSMKEKLLKATFDDS